MNELQHIQFMIKKQVNVHRSRASDPKHCDGQRNEETKWVYIAWQQINKQNTIQLKQPKWNKELKQITNMQQHKKSLNKKQTKQKKHKIQTAK